MSSSQHTSAYDRFRALLTEKRREADVSQANLARRLNKPQSFVSKYERGERRLDVVEFLAICDALGTDPYKILKHLRRDISKSRHGEFQEHS